MFLRNEIKSYHENRPGCIILCMTELSMIVSVTLNTWIYIYSKSCTRTDKKLFHKVSKTEFELKESQIKINLCIRKFLFNYKLITNIFFKMIFKIHIVAPRAKPPPSVMTWLSLFHRNLLWIPVAPYEYNANNYQDFLIKDIINLRLKLLITL